MRRGWWSSYCSRVSLENEFCSAYRTLQRLVGIEGFEQFDPSWSLRLLPVSLPQDSARLVEFGGLAAGVESITAHHYEVFGRDVLQVTLQELLDR